MEMGTRIMAIPFTFSGPRCMAGFTVSRGPSDGVETNTA
jgi:hypothetical protein